MRALRHGLGTPDGVRVGDTAALHSVHTPSVILPNFIGIGAPKAGTTWLAKCLGEHPQVFMAAVKETEFWKLADAEHRLPEYATHFSTADGQRAVGEFSVRYL